ncbi:heparinase II/III family protein [Chitinolyticbacter meiyuanensis]|uniref:heparinase II/III family protein n=1 Tax=Chitinolyticbacter meiyuanensis TaxID=682798 RepID=UPI0011E5FD65|nr:heparinase II/III-family protein [Chitinolyticbacter meiyuanensis]
MKHYLAGLMVLLSVAVADAATLPKGLFNQVGEAQQRTWVQAIAAADHPRSRPSPTDPSVLQGKAWQAFAERTRRDLGGALQGPAGTSDIKRLKGDARLNAMLDANQRYLPLLDRLRDGLLLRAYEGNPQDKALVERAVDQLLGWPADGVSQFAQQDQVARQYALVLSVYLDWFHADIPATRREAVRAAIEPRRRDIEADMLNERTGLAAVPRNSHGWTNAAYLAAMSVLLAEPGNAAARSLPRVLATYERSISPWGGDDGGYANGTMYLYSQLGTVMELWDLVKSASGIDYYSTPWAQHAGDMLAYFTPPGSRFNGFGDGSEKGVAGYIVHAWANRVSNPVNLWLARNTVKSRGDQYLLLTSAEPSPAAAPKAPPPTKRFESIGWAAFHSDLQDRDRTSLYFKSSGYGSYNHSHADQNAFILDHRGRRLLWDSGVYDVYGSPHWRGWYKQTKAHNAITYDDGVGQRVEDQTATGRIVQWGSGGGFDWVVGDATAAYPKGMEQALRGVAYHRASNGFVVWDRLQAGSPHRWEWRLHSVRPFRPDGERRWRTETEDGIALCVRQLAGPDLTLKGSDDMRPAPGRGQSQRLWHSVWSSAPAERLQLLMYVDPECRTESVTATPTTNGWSIKTGDGELRIRADRFEDGSKT